MQSSTKVTTVTGTRKLNRLIRKLEEAGSVIKDIKFIWAHNDYSFLIIYKE